MTNQPRLIKLAPSHFYVAAHWHPEGWTVTIQALVGNVDGSDRQRDVYELLQADELVDVVGATLLRLLGD